MKSIDEQFKWLESHMEEYIQELYEREKGKTEMINLLHTHDEAGLLFFTHPY